MKDDDLRAKARIKCLMACAAPLLMYSALSSAQTGNPGPGLVGITYNNAVEEAAARANQLVFDRLDTGCNPGGILDQLPRPSPLPSPGQPNSDSDVGCSVDQFFIYLNARELVHTANEVRGLGGVTIASLGVDQEGLGTALRWTAAEEFATQGSMATEFANSQLSNLAARMQALRYGVGGFGVADLFRSDSDERYAANRRGPRGGGAAADDPQGETYSSWGGFINGSFGYGSKSPTPLEDAFDFDGSEFTIGVDYRFANDVVFGGIVGISEQAVDFDETASAISVVDGEIDSDGTSVMLFALYQGEKLSISGSLGSQSIDYDAVRDIKYPSFNPNTDSIYSIATSSPTADANMGTFSVGYAITKNRFTFEPIFSLQYLDVAIDAFAENRSINLLSDTNLTRRFDLVVSGQSVDSLDASLGLRFQYVTTPRLGVVIPFWGIEFHKELETDPRTITSGYAALEDILGSNVFVIPTDLRDDSYYTFSMGVSMVLRGGRQRELGGPIVGGLSGFFQMKSVESLDNYEDQVFTGGFRYEF